MRFHLPDLAVAICVLGASQALAGCNTIAGFGRDIQSTGRAVERVGGGESDDKGSASLEQSTAPAAGQSAGNTVYFTMGGSDLSADARSAIAAAAPDAKARNPKRIEVVGYTDTTGRSDYNEQLSMRRAEAVADELVAQGIPRDVIDLAGHGESDPAVPTGDNVAEARNRRAVIDLQV